MKVPTKFLTAAKPAGEAEAGANSDFKPVMMDREPVRSSFLTAP